MNDLPNVPEERVARPMIKNNIMHEDCDDNINLLSEIQLAIIHDAILDCEYKKPKANNDIKSQAGS